MICIDSRSLVLLASTSPSHTRPCTSSWEYN